MKKTTKIILSTLIALIAITLTNSVNANYQIINQSDASSYVRVTGNTFVKNIRSMEASGQVMGLKETKNNTTLLSTSGSNYIDVHLQKNTEYGAMALLSASTKYGKQGTGTARYIGTGTTTGNVWGVYMNNKSGWPGYSEWVAGYVGSSTAFPTTINSKYVNIYTDKDVRFNGDALLSWHGGTINIPSRGIVRGHSATSENCIFSGITNNNNYYLDEHTQSGARAVFVCGEGF